MPILIWENDTSCSLHGILEYPFFAHLRCNAPWQRQPHANWKIYLTIIYDISVSFKGTMHFVNLFPLRNFLPWITPGRFHFSLMRSYPIIVHQDWRGSKLGKAYYKICFSLQNIVITSKNTLKWFYVNVLSDLWYKKLFNKFVPIYSMKISCRQGKLT